MPNAYVLYALIAIMAGVAVPILASLNAGLGQALGNVHMASLVLCIVAFLSILAVMAVGGIAMPGLGVLGKASWWHFAGGIFFMIYVVSITYVAPKIGVGNAIIFVVVAQIFTAVIIDHFGLFGAQISPLSLTRVSGIALMAAGVFVTQQV